MGEIYEMPRQLREKIAAGEVITAPVSVVKELIENSIDAGADEVKVYIEKGGKRLIRVIDNGKGMDRDDLAICAARFTTSKIHYENDLERISTLGFRGEALASIAAVSELRIQSRKRGTEKGYAAEYDDKGDSIEIRESPITAGTDVEVRNLFEKFPVRKKFLKSDDVEASKIISLVTKYSLVNNGISFYLYEDGKEVFCSPKADYVSKILQVFGREIAENVLPVEHSTGDISVNGYISKMGYSRKTRDYQVVFVNGRLVKSNVITDAIEKGFKDKIFLDRYPVAVLHITLSPQSIDVNIHPSKDEIKFKNEYAVADAVVNAVQEAVSMSSNAIQVEAGGRMLTPAHRYEKDKGVQALLTEDDERAIKYNNKKPAAEIKKRPGEEFLRINVLGQLNRTYIIGYDELSLVLIDQHAAQERVFYERFTQQLHDKAVSSNQLIKPFVFSVNKDEEKVIEQYKGTLERYGFRVEPFGRGEYALTAAPALFGKVYDATVIKDIIDELGSGANYGGTINEELDHKIATKACRKAIKGGDILSTAEMKGLLASLSTCTNPYTCPHGRPTLLRMSWGDLEKKFKRTDG